MGKKIFIFLMALTLTLACVACGKETSKEPQNGNTQATDVSDNKTDASDNTQTEVEDNTEGVNSDNNQNAEVIIGKIVTTVEEGCTYYVAETDTTLEAGAEIPAPKEGDKYRTTDYVYTYGFEIGDKKISEWNVRAKDKTKESYGEILYSIAGNKLLYMYRTFENCENLVESPAIPSGITTLYWTYFKCVSMVKAPVLPENVTDMYGTFNNCKALTEAPVIPNGVTRMYRTFRACESLTTVPVIPDSVENMEETFDDCTSLTTVPVIPENVTNMYATFSSCTSLTGTIEINANPNRYDFCFEGVNFAEQNLTLTGSSEKLEKLMNTGIIE